jgi:membrane protease YdiL (CAAX protease family)
MLTIPTIFDSESPLSNQEVLEVRQYAKERIGIWRRRSLYSAVALLLSCASVYPFLKGHPLHEYWESFGKYLVLLSMAMLVVFVLCTGLFYSAWQALRDVEKENG